MHYGTAILQTRVREPRDKAKVGVLVVDRWILARLRHQRSSPMGTRGRCANPAGREID
jgi:hypothetical protein